MEAAGRGEMDVALCLGGNLYGSNPDAAFATNALGKIGQVVYLSTTLNTGHAWGTGRETLILPVLPRDEEPQPTTQESMFSFVRLSDGGPARFEGPRSEVSILADLGRMLLSNGDVDWQQLHSHAAVRELIGELVPDYAPMKDLDATRQEFHVSGRAVDEYRFPTPTGKARFHAIPLPERTGDEGMLRLMTIRSEGQFNTVVYDEEDIYRGQERRDVILMHPDDMQRLGLKDDQPVRIRSEAGELRRILVRPIDIRPGNAVMYYPEANVLVGRGVDPLSKTPAFKDVPVTIEPEE
jgi:anaerobic selenocysteine-containing dehydrogenase